MPYPRHLEQTLEWRVTIRPIRPEDEAAHNELLGAMTPEDLRMRFFGAVRSFDHSQVARMTQIDYDREMAFIVSFTDVSGATTRSRWRARWPIPTTRRRSSRSRYDPIRRARGLAG